jgi:outer membrane protein OmpA-like peptidoglycan-associated protein
LFAFDSDQLTLEGKRLLGKWVDRLNNLKGFRVVIEAHTDSTGRDAYNLGLSRRRGTAVKAWFIQNAVNDAFKFKVDARGETQPVASNSTEEGRARNRRVRLRLERE